MSENFPGITAGKTMFFMPGLSNEINVVHNNYRAGKTMSKAVFDNLFYRIKRDKGYLDRHIRR
ncbi:Cyclic di-GMP regulator cdgR regulator [Erwinia amylovora Ea644]|nr:Cyclic di-GMP regulator cdgR regulator [Erwinia amylovora Ea644]